MKRTVVVARLRVDRKSLAIAALALSALLAGCMGGGTTGAIGPAQPALVAEGTQAPQPGGPTIGSGPVKVAVILPLTGSGAAQGASMRNAAEMAFAEFENQELSLLVKDDRGTADGARDATQAAVDEGAELIIGPLFAATVQSAGQVARGAGKPVIAFSTDSSVASRGVYLLSFLAPAEVDRVIDHTADGGRRSVAALIPETTYGSVVEAQFREAAARRSLRVVAVERYPAGQPQAAVARLAPLVGGANPQADALFLPENPDGLPAVAEALLAAGFDPQRVKPLGTGVWNDPRLFRNAALQGGWFAAPDGSRFADFAGRYRARYGGEPVRLATLSYDAVSVAAALARQHGSQRFSEGVITNAAGFTGADGVFRFKPDGTNDRALAVLEVRGGASSVVSPAPRALPGT
jgi:ABC-type branched-subunit amino acid transport system substrate-binding protein